MREAILDAAERVFADEGEAGLSIRRIADEIDYSPAAIYKYFGSKDELVDILKEAFFGRILQSVHNIVDKSEPFPVRARHCLAGYVCKALEKPHHYAAAFAGESITDRSPEKLAEMADSNRVKAFAVLTGIVTEGIETGHFRPDLPPSDTAKSVWASLHGLAMMFAHFEAFPDLLTMPSGMSRDAFIDFHADLVIRSLERAPGRADTPGRG
ncbi:TetR/AcrR family transcriptional regulator [Henriciella aquimarina]|uniref:TetR/AcrR family transcriptional regulator n=1 Tax=Henriciella aquimarina TaxID=545261 RepID=UPI001F2D4E45|nr:TetR/AcrR family transcriptional regulator [Henriciella aquimarina]